MATIGLSKPLCAKYNYDEGTGLVSYTDGFSIGKYTEMSIKLEGGEANNFYADNGVDESDKTFSGGIMNTTTNDLLADKMTPLLGLKTKPIEGIDDANWLVFDDDQVIPEIGQGGVIKKKVKGQVKFVGFVLPRIQYANPGIAAVTQGETIEWQTQSLSATIMRSDAEGHPWFQITSELNSEAEAEAAVKAFLGITEAAAASTESEAVGV